MTPEYIRIALVYIYSGYFLQGILVSFDDTIFLVDIFRITLYNKGIFMNILSKPLLLNIDDKYKIEITELEFSDKIVDNCIPIEYKYNICADFNDIHPKINKEELDKNIQSFLIQMIDNVKFKPTEE